MKKKTKHQNSYFGTAYTLLIIIAFCWHIGSVYFEEQTNYEEYIESLKTAELNKTPMAKAWLKAGEDAFTDSTHIKLPYSESVCFLPEIPASKAYKFNCKANQTLTIEANNRSNGKVYTELFTKTNNKWTQVAEADSLQNLVYQFKEDSECMLRIQPQLLVEGQYLVNLKKTNQGLNTWEKTNSIASH